MGWIEVNLKINREDEDQVSSFLMDLGINSLSIEDDKLIYDLAKDKKKAEIVDAPDSYSPYIIIKAFFKEDQYDDIKEKIYKLVNDWEDRGRYIELSKEEALEDTNWAREWMKYYETLHIGNLVIVPQWKEYDPQARDIVIKINPGLAFGTGDHATTAMCLEYMQKLDLKEKDVLDMGCGSGILSIAAEKLGASKVSAVDYDSHAIEKTRENISLNSSNNITLIKSDLTKELSGRYDFAMVNIIAEVIVDLLEDLHNYMNESADIIFTGILEEKETMVLDALKDRYEIVGTKKEDGWLAIGAKCIDVS